MSAVELNVIDQFLSDYSTYIDSGFGLVGGEVGQLSNILIAIDVTLAGLFWSLDPNSHLLSRFLRKILYVGAFAFIIGHFSSLAGVVFDSFARLGLQAGGATQSAEALLRPGRLATTGYQVAKPLLDQTSQLLGFPEFFGNFTTIIILMLAWGLVLAAFFILAVQLFVTILEFKLTTLAGFVLTPFALWNKTSFLAEKVLGSVMSSGVKVMVLAMIIAIGTGLFSRLEFGAGQEIDLFAALELVLAAFSLLGLGIFGPSLASGLITGGPQLGAGSAASTAMGLAGGAGLAAAGAMGAGRMAGAALGAVRAGSGLGRTAVSGAAMMASAVRGGGAPGGGSSAGAGPGAGAGQAAGRPSEGLASPPAPTGSQPSGSSPNPGRDLGDGDRAPKPSEGSGGQIDPTPPSANAETSASRHQTSSHGRAMDAAAQAVVRTLSHGEGRGGLSAPLPPEGE